MDKETIRELAVLVHHILMLVDDYLCRKFSLNRRARGKYSPDEG